MWGEKDRGINRRAEEEKPSTRESEGEGVREEKMERTLRVRGLYTDYMTTANTTLKKGR